MPLFTDRWRQPPAVNRRMGVKPVDGEVEGRAVYASAGRNEFMEEGGSYGSKISVSARSGGPPRNGSAHCSLPLSSSASCDIDNQLNEGSWRFKSSSLHQTVVETRSASRKVTDW